VAEGKFHNLSDASTAGARRLVVFEMEDRGQFNELSLMWAWGAELCLAIVGPSWVRNHMSVRIWVAAFRHTKMGGELAVHRVTVSSATELLLGHSPDDTFRVEIMDELVAKSRRVEELCSWLDRTGARIYDLLLRSPLSQTRWADHLDEAAIWLGVELAAWQQVHAKLETLWTLAPQIWYMVLDNVDGPCSLATSLSMAAELLEGRIDIVATNGVC
jgi:hypothetical protein